MNLGRILLSAFFVLLFASFAQARISVSATNGGTFTLTNHGGNEYTLKVTATAPDSDTQFTILPSTTFDVLRTIEAVSSNPGGNTELVIGSTSAKVNSINRIDLLDEQGFTFISSMFLSGSLKEATLNGVQGAQIEGDVLGYLRLKTNVRGSAFLQAIVLGNVYADVTIEDNGVAPFGFIDLLRVEGKIGTPTTPANIRIEGVIFGITAGEINASIRGTGTSGASTFVRQIFQIESNKINGSSGDISGDIRCFMTDFPDSLDVFIRA